MQFDKLTIGGVQEGEDTRTRHYAVVDGGGWMNVITWGEWTQGTSKGCNGRLLHAVEVTYPILYVGTIQDRNAWIAQQIRDHYGWSVGD